MTILPNIEAEKIYQSIFNLISGLSVQDYGYSNKEPEIFLALWKLNHNESLVIVLDVFGHAYLSPFLYNQSPTVNKISFKNLDLSDVERCKINENFKQALIQISM